MGRRVIEIPLETMRRFELAEEAYPQPFLRAAWLGILIQFQESHQKNINQDHNNYNIWFIKLPLDEQGFLQQAARDDFLHRILETLTEITGNELKQQSLDDNPHGFKPREDKMAMFHAKVTRQLEQPPSQFYSHARDYFSGRTGFDQWNFVGLQGIADIAAHLDKEDNELLLAQAIPHLPATPFAALCSCLENINIDKRLTEALARRIKQAVAETDSAITAAALRGLSYSSDIETQRETIQTVLTNRVGKNVEVLATIAGRCWHVLKKSEIRLLYLEALALCDAGQQAFNSILSDLLFLPGLHQPIKEDFNNSRRSTTLANAIDTFLASVHV